MLQTLYAFFANLLCAVVFAEIVKDSSTKLDIVWLCKLANLSSNHSQICYVVLQGLSFFFHTQTHAQQCLFREFKRCCFVRRLQFCVCALANTEPWLRVLQTRCTSFAKFDLYTFHVGVQIRKIACMFATCGFAASHCYYANLQTNIGWTCCKRGFCKLCIARVQTGCAS